MRFAFFTGGVIPAAIAATLLMQSNPPSEPAREGQLTTPYRVEVLARSLYVPWAMIFLPDRRMLFTERTGAVRVMHNDQLMPEPALTIDVAQGNKMGMLGLVVDPLFKKNHFVYLAYDYRHESADPLHPEFRMRVARYREKNDKLLEPTTLIEDIPAWSNHTGGRMRFAADGTLYVTTGDANEPPLAQRLDTYNGKILRLKTDGSAPSDNPFTKDKAAHPEIWSYGHRNPQGLDFQAGTGDILETEHGPLGGDEINWIIPGHNYGWPVIDHRRAQEGMETPFLEFSPSIGPGSASFYRSETFPELHNSFLVGCLRGEGVLHVELNGRKLKDVSWLFHHTFGRIREIVESPEGYLYISTSQQDPVEGVPRTGDDDDLILRIVPATVPNPGHPVYVSSQPDIAKNSAPSGSTEALIARKCAACHGLEMRNGMPLSVTSNQWVYPLDDAAIRNIIRNGISEKGMPPASDLNDGEISSLVKYLRAQSKSNKH